MKSNQKWTWIRVVRKMKNKISLKIISNRRELSNVSKEDIRSSRMRNLAIGFSNRDHW